MKWNFLYQITAASRLWGYRRPQIPVLSVLCPQLGLLNPPKKIPGYATARYAAEPAKVMKSEKGGSSLDDVQGKERERAANDACVL